MITWPSVAASNASVIVAYCPLPSSASGLTINGASASNTQYAVKVMSSGVNNSNTLTGASALPLYQPKNT